MKAKNKTWNEIAAEVGRSKRQVQDRFKEIKATDGGDAGAAAKKDEGGKKNDGGKKGGDDKAEKKKEDKKADKKEDKKQAAERKPPSNKAPSNAGSGQARFTMNEWMTLQEDDLFSFGELQCLSELMMRDERQRWMRIASAFFDKTGRRVHPEDIHDKFVEMGAMGSQR